MTENRRKHPRFPLTVDVRISHPDIGEKVIKTRNVSDGGLFLIVEPTVMPDVGEMVKGQVQGMVDDPPMLNMKIVRTESDGLGLMFIDEQ